MKLGKKIVSLLLVAVMMLTVCGSAMAATIKAPTDEKLSGHSFKAYQIFKGTYSKDETTEVQKLANVEWGDDINSSAFLTELAKLSVQTGDQFQITDTAAVVAEKLAKNPSLATTVARIAKECVNDNSGTAVNGDTQVADGYYVIVDETSTGANSLNASLLKVVGTITIEAKTDAPSVEKKVKENVKYTENAGYGAGYNDVADYNIGDAVPFKLIGRIPDMTNFDTYKYTFTDTLSKGLTLNNLNDIQVYVATSKDADTGTTITPDTKEIVGEDGQAHTITIGFNNLKSVTAAVKDSYIIVKYSATLNSNAEIGLPGNENKVHLTYSNNPDKSGTGEHETKNTPDDVVIVFTYEGDTSKVDVNNQNIKLQGAEFVLLDSNTNNAKAAIVANGKVTGWQEVTSNTGEDGAVTYTYPEGSKLTSVGTDAKFVVTGLDAGTYYLKEIKAPLGYNLPSDPFTVVITAVTANGQNWTPVENNTNALTSLKVNVGTLKSDGTTSNVETTGNVSNGTVDITIGNSSGSTLPETGGMGTTILYVVGGLLVVAAAVLLMTKKRVGADK